jgi:N-acetylglucosaminyldiphosphoundecaprenol N-acetyl-beta-D-mannosaminyltransferase
MSELPPRYPVAGVLASATTYAEATRHIIRAARDRRSLLVAATSVHGVTVAAADAQFRKTLNEFDLVTPDGQPVRWGLNLLHNARLGDRVYGPTLMLHVCEAAASLGLSVYFYGSTEPVLAALRERLAEQIPSLRIAGAYSPPFRPTTAEEDVRSAREIANSGASIVFVGLGCPRQERWAYAQRERLSLPLVCVGAAFDFHAGLLRQAPAWMQRRGLEWAFRLAIEPRRLWRRYFRAVPVYLFLLGRQYLAMRLR